MDEVDLEHFFHHRKFCRLVLLHVAFRSNVNAMPFTVGQSLAMRAQREVLGQTLTMLFLSMPLGKEHGQNQVHCASFFMKNVNRVFFWPGVLNI